jgi:hypothetical protein
MQTFEGALIREQGVAFGVVVCRRGLANGDKNALMGSVGRIFGGVPVVAMEQDQLGVPTYYGRTDLVRFLASVPMEAIPWKKYTIT